MTPEQLAEDIRWLEGIRDQPGGGHSIRAEKERAAAERRQGEGFRVRLGSGRFARVIGTGPTRGRAWADAAGVLNEGDER